MVGLDRSRPFGTIFGDEEGRFFEQDGVYFDAHGKALAAVKVEAVKPAPVKPAAKPAAKIPASKVAVLDVAAPAVKPLIDPAASPLDAQVSAQMKDAQ